MNFKKYIKIICIATAFIFMLSSCTNPSEDSGETSMDSSDTDTEDIVSTDTEAELPYISEGVDILHKGHGDNAKYVVVIDAGHQKKAMSGKEPMGPDSDIMKDMVAAGTVGKFSGVNEYELTLKVSLALRDKLMDEGYTVVMVRETHDVSVSNKERAIIANKYAPSAENGYSSAINIRIHANGFSDSSANGALMCCPTEDNPYKIGEIYDDCLKLANALIDPYCESTSIRKRPSYIQYGDNMTGTNWCEIPTTILEMGFMTNEHDDLLMNSENFPSLAADGLFKGIENYFKA